VQELVVTLPRKLLDRAVNVDPEARFARDVAGDLVEVWVLPNAPNALEVEDFGVAACAKPAMQRPAGLKLLPALRGQRADDMLQELSMVLRSK
jgi:hypothetical protein